jgi:fatty-acyl-CoA synthase
MQPTPTKNNLPLRKGDFTTLAEALDYAAQGNTGFNFYDGTGKLSAVLPYKRLRKEARSIARRLLGLGPRPGARVALVADTDPDFMRYFFACQYAGLVPIPLPAPIQLGDRRSYGEQLRNLLITCNAEIAIAQEAHLPVLMKAAASLDLSFYGGSRAFVHLPEADDPLRPSGADDVAYLQFTSGSTRFPRGVMISQNTVMNNLASLIGGVVQFRNEDRAVSWLPFYHDMGLVGMVLAPLAAQVSVDYLNPRDFAMRPRLWPKLISENRGTISFGSARGYDLCQRRLRPANVENLDLSPWRVAAVGAETIRSEPLVQFADHLAPAGFKSSAFVVGYGMAECSLAVSFSPLDRGLMIDDIKGRNIWPQDLEGIAEQQPEVRTGDALAISVPGTDGKDMAVLLIQCRNPEKAEQSDLADRIRVIVWRQFRIDCMIEWVARHTLPRTTSGKLSRSQARTEYLDRMADTQSIRVGWTNQPRTVKRVA